MSNFQPAGFLSKTNIYEVNIRQYTAEGTFKAFASYLPRLKDMGVEILWLMPVHPIGSLKRKGSLGSYYSIKDFSGINPEFGTKKDFKDLVMMIHGLGMKVIMDWIANHAAWDNVWTITNPSFFLRDEQGNFLSPYDWDDVIQIDHSNPLQQETMINAMTGWVNDFDIDGFRADLAHLTPLSFWKKARAATGYQKNDLIWLAETEEISYHEAFDISYTWEWMHTTESFFKEKTDLVSIINVLKNNVSNFPSHAHRMFFTTNHDENSWNGTEYEKYDKHVNALAVFNSTYNSIPLVYSGQELPNHKRLLFFDKDRFEWEDIQLHEFYKTLYELRKRNNSILSGVNNIVFFEQLIKQNVLGYYRSAGSDKVIVLLNFSNSPVHLKLDAVQLQGTYMDIFNKAIFNISNELNIDLPTAGFLVLEKINVIVKEE